ncbi:MAG: PQQ-like beta-propeller repeat protein [Planctomycetaceae bacterium]|nr:PQQ-like beta-propeller repeat protein [Planctomycetaceae bacterium]
MPDDCTHPFLCCEPNPCCAFRLVDDTPAVVWSRPNDEGPCDNPVAVASDGTNLYVGYGATIEKWDQSGNLLWTADCPSDAITADGNSVWGARYVSGATEGYLQVRKLLASDGSTVWTTQTDDDTGTTGVGKVFALANDGTNVYTAGSEVIVGSDVGLGVKIDGSGTILGVYGFHPAYTPTLTRYAAASIALSSDSIYLAWGGATYALGAYSSFVGTHIERWDATTLDWIYRAPCARVRTLSLYPSNDLYIGKDAGFLECTLERWDADTATPQWGVLVKGDYLSNDGPVFDSDMGVGVVSIQNGIDLWVLAGDFDTAVQHYAYELRQYDTSGNRISCHPAATGTNPNRGTYAYLAASSVGAYVAGNIPCTTDDEITCAPDDGACTPVEPCPEECGTLSIHGKAVTEGCDCREGIGDGCISINFAGCTDLNPPGDLETEFQQDPVFESALGCDFVWFASYSLTLCGETASVYVQVCYTCADGWSALVRIAIDLADPVTVDLTDFLAFPGCGQSALSGPDFEFNAPLGLPECVGCGGDQSISISLRDSCGLFMMAPMVAASDAPTAPRLMASIDGPAAAVGLILHDAGGDEWMDEDGILIFTENVATIGDESGPVTILSRRPFLAIATVGPNEIYVTEEV